MEKPAKNLAGALAEEAAELRRLMGEVEPTALPWVDITAKQAARDVGRRIEYTDPHGCRRYGIIIRVWQGKYDVRKLKSSPADQPGRTLVDIQTPGLLLSTNRKTRIK